MDTEEKANFTPAADDAPIESTAAEPDTDSEAAEAQATLSGQEIVERMATIRLRIDEHTDELVTQVNALSDWRSYVRRHPWLSVSAAAAIGFAVVPSRPKPGTVDFMQNPSAGTTTPAAEHLRSVLVGAAKKAATAYATRSIGEILRAFTDSDERPTP